MQEKLKNTGIAPIFFVGSGISRRYINSPNWIGLLEEIVVDRDINFTKLVQKYSDGDGVVNNESLAQELEDIYFDKLDDGEIEDGGNKPYYFRKKIANIMNKYLQNNLQDLEKNAEVVELKKTRPAAIITTNYDKVMEVIFGDDYSVLVGQESLLESVVDGVGEIYKIHGCVTSPNSILITKSDYDHFFDKSKYLNAKLLTLFLEYPIVFMGYSISDRNIINILSTIVEMLSPEKVDELKRRIWFVERSENGKDEKTVARVNLNNGHYLDIDSFRLTDYGKLYSAISDISIKRMPMKFLKYLKNNVYELIASQEYNPKLLNVNVEDLEDINNFEDTNQFVGLTFSTDRKIGFCNNEIICQEFIQNDSNIKFDERDLLEYRKNKKVPFYKFLKSLSKEEVLSKIHDKTTPFYQQIINDNVDYSLNIGKEQIVNFVGDISKDEIVKYADNFVRENGLQINQKNSVIRYVILQLITNDIKCIIDAELIIQDYKLEIVKVMTHLSDDFIVRHEAEINDLLKALVVENISERKFRYLLCHLDRALYRKE